MATKSRRRTADRSSRTLVALAFLLPLTLWRGVLETFAVPRLALLALGSLVVLALHWNQSSFGSVRKATVVGSATLLLGWQILVSDHPMVSIAGNQNTRVGLISVWSLFVLAVVVSAGSIDTVRRVLLGLVSGASVSATYGLVQFWDLDPIDWYRNEGWVTSTFGNPNIGSAVYAIGFVLVLGLGLSHQRGSNLERWLLPIAGAVLLGGVHATDSFQGVVALAAVGIVAHRYLRPALRPLGSLVGSVVVAGVLVVWLSRSASTSTLMVTILAGGVLSWASMHPIRSEALRQRWTDAVAGFVLVIGVVGTVLVFDTLRAQVEQGHYERRFFWSTAWKMFGEAPIAGWGFDQFAVNYTRFRPAEHARILENTVATSPHSMFLSLLVATGAAGVLIFLSGLGLLARRAVVRRTELASDATFVPAVAASVAIVIVASVSIDTLGILSCAAVVVGALVASVARPADVVERKGAKGRDSRPARPAWDPAALVGAGLMGAFVVVIVVMVFVAGVESRNSENARLRSDSVTGLDAIEAAHRFEPWNGAYSVDYGRGLYAVERFDEAEEVFREAVRQVDYRAPITIQTALFFAQRGQYAESATFLQEAILNDPYAAGPLRKVVEAVDEILSIRGSELSAEEIAAYQAARDDAQGRLDRLQAG